MPVYNITDQDDPRVAVYRDLPRARDRSEDGRFIAEGRFLVERLWESGLPIESILTDETHREFALTRSHPETSVLVAAKSLLDATLGFHFHRGVLACGVYETTAELNSQLLQLGDKPAVFVVLDRIVDQENMGGVIRAAAGLGAAGVLVGPESARPYSRRALRVSMGAVFSLPPVISTDLGSDIAKLKAAGFKTVATILGDDAVSLERCARSNRVAVILGNEGQGVSERCARHADSRVTIPMSSKVDSLNVTAAAAIFIHHFVQQIATDGDSTPSG